MIRQVELNRSAVENLKSCVQPNAENSASSCRLNGLISKTT